MKVNIQSLHFTASEELKTFVHEKVSKLEHFNEKILSAEVTLFAEDPKMKENKHCEIRLVVPGNDDFVKKNAESFEAAVLNSVDALQKILRRKKEKY